MCVSELKKKKKLIYTLFKIQLVKDMKKIEYVAPEMEEIKLMHNVSLLGGSNEDQAPGTGGDVDEY